MKKEVVRKTSLRDAEDALCVGQTAAERLRILAELNRIGLAALGVTDEPLRRFRSKSEPRRWVGAGTMEPADGIRSLDREFPEARRAGFLLVGTCGETPRGVRGVSNFTLSTLPFHPFSTQ
ncbi:MAG: hypothetical protein IJ783_04885 [Kiritimatiellae bacterium]|nr:hypothetical protein [Kiritimatiellia bacterium]